MKWSIPLIVLIFFEILGNFLAGIFGSEKILMIAPLALTVYATANIFWLMSLKNGSGLARGSVYFGLGTLILTSIIAIIFFSEPITMNLIAGMTTGIVSIILLSD